MMAAKKAWHLFPEARPFIHFFTHPLRLLFIGQRDLQNGFIFVFIRRCLLKIRKSRFKVEEDTLSLL